MARGTVKWFNQASGYGYIVDGDGRDLFVHRTSLKAGLSTTMTAGDDVEYVVREGGMGSEAIDVSTSAPADLTCSSCGYRISARDPLPPCPMCQANDWERIAVWESEGGRAALEIDRSLGLDWKGFSTRHFPDSRRHDLGAIKAYEAQRAA